MNSRLRARRPCPACKKLTRDGMLCHHCTAQTRAALTGIIYDWTELQATITRQDQLGPLSEVRAEQIYGPLPYKLAASRTATDIETTLRRWTTVLVHDFRIPIPVSIDRAPLMCRLLLGWLPRLRSHACAAEFASDTLGAWASLRHAIDTPDERSRVKVGPCPGHTEDAEPCGGTLWGRFPADPTLPATVTCEPDSALVEVCGTEWPSRSWDQLGTAVMGRIRQVAAQRARASTPEASASRYMDPPAWLGGREFISVPDAASIYGVPSSTLRRWVAEGDLPNHGPESASKARRDQILLLPVEVTAAIGRHRDREARRGASGLTFGA